VEVAHGVHLLRTEGCNVCLVTSPEMQIFDAGPPGSGPKLCRLMRQQGLPPEGIVRILLTHSDLGHTGAAACLRAETGARIGASSVAADILAGRSSPGPLRQIRQRVVARDSSPWDVDMKLAEGDEVGGFVVLETPGHTRGDICFYRQEDGVLIVGDAARIAGRDILAPSFWNSYSEVTARISLSALAELPVRILIAGHGPAYALPQAALRKAGGPPGFVEDLVRRRAAYRASRHKTKRPPKPGGA